MAKPKARPKTSRKPRSGAPAPLPVQPQAPFLRRWLVLAAVALTFFCFGLLAGARQGWVEENHGQGQLPPGRYKVKQLEDGTYVRHGTYEGYHPRKITVGERGEYFYGKKLGPWTEYHPSGKVSGKGSYVEGGKAGDWRYWDEAGQEILPKKP